MSTFQDVQPTDEQKEMMQSFRDKYETLYNEIKQLTENIPSGRRFALALTNLELSAMWLNKAIIKNE